MAKLSVILPSLDVGGYIRRAVGSAMGQSFSDIEILCIDAGSTDGTWEAIQGMAREDSRVRAWQSPVRSYGYQVNMGLARARGKYVAVLETDDFVSGDMYGALYGVAEREGLDYIKCDYDTYDGEGADPLPGEGGCPGPGFVRRRLSPDNFFYENIFPPAMHPEMAVDDWYLWNGIYRLSFLRENRIRLSETPGAAFQDIGFLHRVSARAGRVRFFPRPLYHYCTGREGASSRSTRALRYIRWEYGSLLGEGGMPWGGHPVTGGREASAPDFTGGAASAGKGNGESAGAFPEVELVLLYRRMACSFIRACMAAPDDLLKKQENREIGRWFQERLLWAARRGYVGAGDLPEGLRGGFRQLMRMGDPLEEPLGSFLAWRAGRRGALAGFLGAGHPVVVFGCGSYGREAQRFLLRNHYPVAAFMDNDKALWGKKIGGVEVTDPAKAGSFPADTRYVIANEKYAGDIRRQLAGYVGTPHTFVFAMG